MRRNHPTISPRDWKLADGAAGNILIDCRFGEADTQSTELELRNDLLDKLHCRAAIPLRL